MDKEAIRIRIEDRLISNSAFLELASSNRGRTTSRFKRIVWRAAVVSGRAKNRVKRIPILGTISAKLYRRYKYRYFK